MIRRIPRAQAEGRILPLDDLAHEPAQGPPAEGPAGSCSAALSRALVALLSEELTLAPAHVERVIARELLRVRRAAQSRVRVHPDDLALLKTEDAYRAELELLGKLTLCSDPTLSRGGCVIESNMGEIDARIETRLGLMLKLLESGALA